MTHIAGRDSITLLTAYAARTERVKLGTGVIPIYARTPANMAQSFATLDEFSGGSAIAGLGVSHRPVVEHWYGQSIDKPLGEMREYVGIVRAILRGEDPPPGEKWSTAFHLTGWEAPRPDMPIYLAGLSPGMLRLAGEIADGVVLWLCNPNYLRDVVVPTVREGREKAGRPLEGFDIVAPVPSSVTDDPDAARESLRAELVPYFGAPLLPQDAERCPASTRTRARPTSSSASWRRSARPTRRAPRCAAMPRPVRRPRAWAASRARTSTGRSRR